VNYRLETLKMLLYSIDYAENNGRPTEYSDKQFDKILRGLHRERGKIIVRIKKIETNAANRKPKDRTQ
jgi:hypothetical protein